MVAGEGSRDKGTLRPHFARTRLAYACCPGIVTTSASTRQDRYLLSFPGRLGSLPLGVVLGLLQRLPPSWILVHWPQDFGKERRSQGLSGARRRPVSSPRGPPWMRVPAPCRSPPRHAVCAHASASVCVSRTAGGQEVTVKLFPRPGVAPTPRVRAPHNILRLPTAGPSLSHPSAVATGPHVLPRGFSAPCSPPGNWHLFKTLLEPSSSGCPLPFPGSPTDELHQGLFSSTRSPSESYFGHITVKSPGTKLQGVTGVWTCVSKKTRPGRGWRDSGGGAQWQHPRKHQGGWSPLTASGHLTPPPERPLLSRIFVSDSRP